MTIGRMIEIVVLVVLIIITAYYYVKARKEAALKAREEDARQNEEIKIIQTVKIEGMMCPKCAARVCEALGKFGTVTINLEEKTATITSSELADVSEIEAAVTELGYKFEGIAE